jgi:fucose permease
LLVGPKTLGIICIGASGAGQGLAVPAANLMVAEANPGRRSATLNWLNFSWSAGAVACPFLIATATKIQHIPLFLTAVAIFSVAVALGIALMPAHIVEPAAHLEKQTRVLPLVRLRLTPFLMLAALFFLYVGTENGFGGWVASYSKSLGSLSPAMALATPSFFYAALMLGRSLAPFLLRNSNEIALVRAGLLIASAGTAGLLFASGLPGVLASACLAGLGLSFVYPITISLLSKEFGAASSRIGSVMFVLSNIGGGLLPWIVGISSNRFATLKAGLAVPLIGCLAMLAFYLRDWNRSLD